jgi:hypothetical protein
MSLQVCGQCGTRYAIGVAACPHCSSTELAPDEVGRVPFGVSVSCTTDGCRAVGQSKRVPLRRVAMGVVELPTYVCEPCGHPLAVRWPGELRKETDMPKITVHGGASNAAADPPDKPVYVGEQGAEPWDPSKSAAENLGAPDGSVSEHGTGEIVAVSSDVTVSTGGVDQGPGEVDEIRGGPFEPLPEVQEDGELAELVSKPDYEKWTVPQLKDALDQMGLSTAGLKPELVARLQEAVRDDE